MEQADADYKSVISPMLINLQGTTAKPLSPEWLVCHAENFPMIIIYDPQFSVNSLSATKNKRLLFKVVNTNWTHNNSPFLDTHINQLQDVLIKELRWKQTEFGMWPDFHDTLPSCIFICDPNCGLPPRIVRISSIYFEWHILIWNLLSVRNWIEWMNALKRMTCKAIY